MTATRLLNVGQKSYSIRTDAAIASRRTGVIWVDDGGKIRAFTKDCEVKVPANVAAAVKERIFP